MAEKISSLIINNKGKAIKIYINGHLNEETSAMFTAVICSLGDHIQVKTNGFLGEKLIAEIKMPTKMANYSVEGTSIEF